jgi:phosphate-induced protein 1
MSRRLRALGSIAGLALLAGCADSSRTVTGPSSPAPSFARGADQGQADQEHGPGHIFELRNSPAIEYAKPSGGGGTGIFYHGGPVLQAQTDVVAVYWASGTIYNNGPTAGTTGTGSGDGSLVGYFLSHLGGSPYFNINTTYTDGSGQAIVNKVNYNAYWANNTNVPANGQSVSGTDMVAMLQSGFDTGKLSYDANALYVIFSAGTVNLGGGFGTQYCAYHTHGTVTVGGVSKTVLYAAMPYVYAYPSACTNGTAAPNGDPAADGVVNVLAHEVEETTTDMMGNAWFDRRGYENADKCAWNFGTTQNNGTGVWNIIVGTKNFLVQQNWVNAGSGGCRQTWP